MDYRGPALMLCGVLCIAAAGLAHEEDKRRSLNKAVASTIGKGNADCMANGFDTPVGRVGCMTQTSHAFSGGVKGLRLQRGGSTVFHSR